MSGGAHITGRHSISLGVGGIEVAWGHTAARVCSCLSFGSGACQGFFLYLVNPFVNIWTILSDYSLCLALQTELKHVKYVAGT